VCQFCQVPSLTHKNIKSCPEQKKYGPLMKVEDRDPFVLAITDSNSTVYPIQYSVPTGSTVLQSVRPDTAYLVIHRLLYINQGLSQAPTPGNICMQCTCLSKGGKAM
jgi:hypothetical protein